MSADQAAQVADGKRPVKIFVYASLGFLILTLLAIGLLTAAFVLSGPAQTNVRIVLPQGASLLRISKSLAEQGMIYHPALFRAGVRLLGQSRNLQAGEYEIPAGVSSFGLMQLLVSGRTHLHAVTIPEGLTSQQVVTRLQNNPILTGGISAVPAEGSLLPETYRVRRGTGREDLVKLMQKAQQELLARLWDDRRVHPGLPDRESALILASIVQKETGKDEEYGLVASVFLNRLEKNMRLQSDPTIIYGLVGGAGSLNRPIRRSEIRKKTEYNTYQINGLPPTPISNPGLAALQAVLKPVASPYYYFVADGTGGHAFAETLSEHEENVRVWRKISAQKN